MINIALGIIVNSSAVVIGGLIGGHYGYKINEDVLDQLPIVFGLSAIAIGITLISLMENLIAVVLALITGAILGEVLKIELNIKKALLNLFKKGENQKKDTVDLLIIVIVLFCFSGTGIFGALNEGFTGDSKILLVKSIMDFFTAIIFGASVGYTVSLIAIPQFLINLMLYSIAGFIVPLLSLAMLNDFKACGGIITFAAALKVARIKDIRVLNLLPALILVPFLSKIIIILLN